LSIFAIQEGLIKLVDNTDSVIIGDYKDDNTLKGKLNIVGDLLIADTGYLNDLGDVVIEGEYYEGDPPSYSVPNNDNKSNGLIINSKRIKQPVGGDYQYTLVNDFVGSNYSWYPDGDGSEFRFWTQPKDSRNPEVRLIIKADGNVGIGTESPGSYKLNVAGDINAEYINSNRAIKAETYVLSNAIYGKSYNSSSPGAIEDIWIGDTNDAIKIQGSLFVGSSGPGSYKLDVTGNINASGKVSAGSYGIDKVSQKICSNETNNTLICSCSNDYILLNGGAVCNNTIDGSLYRNEPYSGSATSWRAACRNTVAAGVKITINCIKGSVAVVEVIEE